MDLVLGVLFRWIHIVSVVILIGGVFYARFCAQSYSSRFRPWILVTIVAILGSGLYNLFTKATLPPMYHMWFGIKMLLVLHVFVVGLLVTSPASEEPKKLRLMAGMLYSGLVIFSLSAYLRWISAS